MTLKYEYGLELGFHRPNSRMEHCTTEMLNDAFGAPPAPPATPDAPEPAPETYYDRAVKQYLSYGLPPASAKRHASSDIRKRIERGYTMPEEPRMITRDTNRQVDMKEKVRVMAETYFAKQWKAAFPGHNGRGRIQWMYESMGQLEVQSPVMSSFEEVSCYYNMVTDVARKLSLTRVTEEMSSVGGHLHVSELAADHWSGKFLHWLFWDAATRPYITWAFCDPEDNEQAKCLFSQLGELSSDDHTSFGIGKSWMMQTSFPKSNSSEQKQTLEMRFFEAPNDLAEQVLHIQFVEAWLTWAKQAWRDGVDFGDFPILDNKVVQGADAGEAKVDMLGFLALIGLDPQAYVNIVERNITKRFSLGEEYLT